MICKICGNSKNNNKFKIREMMFGSKEVFSYMECNNCGCLQIMEIPKNMEKYYPTDKYKASFRKEKHDLKQFFIKKGDEYAILKKGIIGRLIYKKFPNLFLEMIGGENINYNSRILDVGCGTGDLLNFFSDMGFKNLTGIEPFMYCEIGREEVKVHKKFITELDDKQEFDIIILNHSLEHISNQLEVLVKISNLLDENGACLIQMPIKTEYIWELYGVNWVQIDAPRHFFIHTLKSFDFLVKKTNLNIEKLIFDSNDFQFWGSEQYKNDIPLESGNSYSINPKESMFTRRKINEFRMRAEELNELRQGDTADFLLKRNV